MLSDNVIPPTKRTVLVFTDWFLPGFRAGGPIRSLANLMAVLSDSFDFYVVTRDRDLFASVPYPDTPVDIWTTRAEGIRVLYLSPSNQSVNVMAGVLRDVPADIIYLNSVFSSKFTLLPLMILKFTLQERRMILAPRGMLGAGALGLKPIKKACFLSLARFFSLFKRVNWHASSELEAQDIRRAIGNSAEVSVALNMSPSYAFCIVPREKTPGSINTVFISRISRKKNLIGVIDLLAQVPSNRTVDFSIFGPIEDGDYWDECCREIDRLPSNITARYCGELQHEDVGNTLSSFHLSFLLTLNENFGHTIIESMASGCLVLISTHTPWRNLPLAKAGWDVGLDSKAEQLNALNVAIEMDQVTFDTWSIAAMEFARSATQDDSVSISNRLLFS